MSLAIKDQSKPRIWVSDIPSDTDSLHSIDYETERDGIELLDDLDQHGVPTATVVPERFWFRSNNRQEIFRRHVWRSGLLSAYFGEIS